MIQTIRKAWGIPELRKKIVFTLLILLIFRLGNAIMVPYINRDALALQMQVWGTGLLGLYNVMSGGAFATATVFALSIQPYINSSIIIQLLTVAIPALERLARDGGGGRILLAEGMGLPDADGKESGAYHGDRGWYQERGQRGMQHGTERVLRVRRGKRRLRPCEGSDVRRKAVLYGVEGSQGRL